VPFKLDGSYTNRCSAHKNKMIYGDPNTVISVVLKTQERFGIKLAWYKCDVWGGYHLCKFENKQD
jgi:hypothetical protein